jgi:hypothetical protein
LHYIPEDVSFQIKQLNSVRVKFQQNSPPEEKVILQPTVCTVKNLSLLCNNFKLIVRFGSET